jgi:recombination protein RecT
MENKQTTIEVKAIEAIAPQKTKLTVQNLFAKEDVRARFTEMLGKKAQGFITSVLQITTSNELLKNADPLSIYNAAATAATLDLPLNNNLGFAYIIPYKQRDKEGNFKDVAQFQLGYKGFIQLAQRSGQFQTISASPIYEGQLIEQNPLTGFVFDFTKKTSDKVIGYASYFKLINGFEKTLFMSVDEMNKHGVRFSKTFAKGFGLWKDDFDSMALKTVLKLLLSKFAPLSIEMQRAVMSDQAIINDVETQDVTYVDNEPAKIDTQWTK